jgi:molybdate transport system substrate-binding protein
VRAPYGVSGTAAAVVAVSMLAACGQDPGPADASGVSGDVSGDIAIFAAASLTEGFEEIAARFEAEHPEVSVVLNVGSSTALAQQILAGAPADVFASAAPSPMDQLTGAGMIDGTPEVFARNTLQIAVPAGNPGDVRGLSDFADPDLTIALCAEQVPCGTAAAQAFDAAGITPAPDTLEQDVKAVLSKVRLGEVDAALVYRTDVIAAGDDVRGISFPEAEQAVNDYPIGALADAPNPAAARAFVDHVLSSTSGQALADAGFDRP